MRRRESLGFLASLTSKMKPNFLMLRFLNGRDYAALQQHVLMVAINSRAGFTILVYGLGFKRL
jgi:hypothetical protein